jgi:hypothetical protein
MHCEKNVCDNLLKAILGEKDFVVIQKDMEELGIRPKLWVQQMANGSYMKPKAPYVMTNEEKDVFLQTIKKLKTPTNYASTLKSKVQKDGKLRGLKSHDYHILMQ